MNTFSTTAMIVFGWETFKKQPWLFVGAAGVLAGAEILLQLVGRVPFLGFIVSVAGGTIVGMGMVHFSLRAHESVSTTSLNSLWFVEPFWRYLGATLLKGVVVAGPVLLGAIVIGASAVIGGHPGTGFSVSSGFVVPMLFLAAVALAWLVYMSVRLAFVEYLVVDTGRGPVHAIKESFRMTQGHVGRLALLMLAFALINIGGAIVLFVGLLVSIPVTILAMAHAYRTLCPAAVANPVASSSAPLA